MTADSTKLIVVGAHRMRDGLDARTCAEAIARTARSHHHGKKRSATRKHEGSVGAYLVRDSLEILSKHEAIAHKVRSYGGMMSVTGAVKVDQASPQPNVQSQE